MANRLAGSMSPYLRAHADNPVDWHPWGAEAFDEARRRDVPILLSIGYATCHWCHVMARESFSDPELAAYLNPRFVAVKVDREEHPDVDATYLAAASAFTPQLGWPLTVFLTPQGRAFHAGTYYPPVPARGTPSFRQVLGAVSEAWQRDRERVAATARTVVDAVARLGGTGAPASAPHADEEAAALAAAREQIVAQEDEACGGFGTAPKFPMTPVLGFLLETAEPAGHPAAHTAQAPDGRQGLPAAGPRSGREVAVRALRAMAASALRDPVEGGFFRYATRRDWSVPHYERMLYDNAQLLAAYTKAGVLLGAEGPIPSWVQGAAAGTAGFLLDVLRRPGGGFGSAQDSESLIDGRRSEGGYYALDAVGRHRQSPPAVDGKVLAGWNGLAIAALADAGLFWRRPDWTDAACHAADHLLVVHRRADGALARASLDGEVSAAPATLEDYGLLAGGLLRLALAGGGARYAVAARDLVDAALAAAEATGDGAAAGVHPFRAPTPRDPLLAAQAAPEFTSDAAVLPTGETACADAAHLLWQMTGQRRYDAAAAAVTWARLPAAAAQPLSAGALLALAQRRRQERQVVTVTPDGVPARPDVVAAALALPGIHAVVSEADAGRLAQEGFTLFEDRGCGDGQTTVYVCRDFTCELPATDPEVVARL